MKPEIKAKLISIGKINIDEVSIDNLRLGYSASGPGAGSESIFIKKGGKRVRLTIAKDSPLILKENEIIMEDEIIIDKFELEEPILHCPKQAYITVDASCIFDCKFCPVPKLKGENRSVEKVLDMIRSASKNKEFSAISLTSGVPKDPREEVIKLAKIIRLAKEEFNVPIGVSPYSAGNEGTDLLYSAGADEIKYNIESYDQEIFKRTCKDLSLDEIIDSLKYAVEVFGENKVTSNMIIGLGESDETVIEGIEHLASIGVIPILRALVISPLRRGDLMRSTDNRASRPSADRLLRLAIAQKEILDSYGLKMDKPKTMCPPCTGCDLTPHRDIL
ncbi:MAG: radical SAM protein [Candidatus Hydrothermarchaeota archaeon]